ncbi:MAG: ABC transporter ATP-binding protein [Nocardiopsaceae bacterium]|nr:ABC transporter ATP-binding protein [Nocardiopsaceae bacterium]
MSTHAADPETPASTARGVGIEINGVSKRYPSGSRWTAALDPLRLSVRPGEFVSVLGPSGCGKSTLMLMVAGLLAPSTGQIAVGGKNVTKPLTDVGIVFQNHLLLEFRSALDNVALQEIVRGTPKAEARRKARVLLDRMGLGPAADRYPDQLSGGMRQRAAIARAFIHNPSMLLMDEPFGALDAISRVRMQHELEQLWLDEYRKTVLFITHSVEEAVRLSDRVVVLSSSPGHLVEEITVDVAHPRPLVTDSDPKLVEYTRRIYELFSRLGVFGD